MGESVKPGDRVSWHGRHGTVTELDTTAQLSAVGRLNGWPVAAWVKFDDRETDVCVNAADCVRAQ